MVMFVLMLACIFDDSVSFLPIALFSCWGWFWEWTKKMPFCKPLARDCGTGHSWRLVAVPLGSPEGTAFALILFDVPTIFFLYSVSCAFFWGGAFWLRLWQFGDFVLRCSQPSVSVFTENGIATPPWNRTRLRVCKGSPKRNRRQNLKCSLAGTF